MDEQNKIVFKTTRDSIDLVVRLENDTVWLRQEQIAILFDKERSVITKHINNVFKEKELSEESNVQNLHISGSDRPVKFYSLDVIISVGYRVKSQQGTQFRIWANKILKDHIVKGYTLNTHRLKLEQQRYKELLSNLNTLKKVYDNEKLQLDEAKGLIKVITDYADALNTLDLYDQNKLTILKKSNKKSVKISYEDALEAINQLRLNLDAGNLFGNERDGGLKSALLSIFQTYDGKDLYSSIEEKSANLLYLIIKNHPFIDGNKRIGSFMFVRFLDLNGLLYKENGQKNIEENALVAIALLIAQSDPKDKELMVKLVSNLINGLD